MSQSNRKPASLFEREMQKPSFRRAYEAERKSFALKVKQMNVPSPRVAQDFLNLPLPERN